MATVESWCRGFFLRHVERIPRPDWPLPSSPFWTTFRGSLSRLGVTEIVADKTSELMAERPPVFPDAHIAKFVETVREIWKSAEVAEVSGDNTRDSACLLSKECGDCGGNGFAIRYAHNGGRPRSANSFALYCVCPMGRWLENAHRMGSEPGREARRRIGDLMDHPALQVAPVAWAAFPDNRYRYRLADWDVDLNQPKPVEIGAWKDKHAIKSAKEAAAKLASSLAAKSA